MKKFILFIYLLSLVSCSFSGILSKKNENKNTNSLQNNNREQKLKNVTY